MSRFDMPTLSVEGGSGGKQNITWQTGGTRRPSGGSNTGGGSSSGGGSYTPAA